MITILCSGSRGDIQPYVAIAQELKAMGKYVRIAAGSSFKAFVEEYGINFFSLSADYKTANIDPRLLEAAGSSTNPLKMLLTFNKMKQYARLMVDEMYDACQGSELILYHPGCTIGYFAAEKMGIPSVMASPFPMLQTSEVASVIAYGKSRMPVKMSYVMLQGMLWMASKTGVKSFWKEKFDKLPDHFGCPFERVDRRHPSMVSCSNYVFPRPSDWKEGIHQYGYWFVKEIADHIPPRELAAYLENGEKPVYFGFGSMFNEKEKDTFVDIVAETLRRTGKRGIVCGMGKMENLPKNILAIEEAPHSWLFPRCAAVCHHGGAGTTAAGFSAGLPSIIIPFSNDQFAWAHRAHDIGVGPKPIYKNQLSVQNLSKAVTEAFSEKMRAESRRLGEKIASENGARDCAAVLAGLLSSN